MSRVSQKILVSKKNFNCFQNYQGQLTEGKEKKEEIEMMTRRWSKSEFFTFCITPLYRFVEDSGCPLTAVYRRMMELSTRNQFLVTYKDISVHNIVQYNLSFYTVCSVILMMVFCMFTCFSLGNSCGKLFYILYLVSRWFWEPFMHYCWYIYLILISIICKNLVKFRK